MKKVTWCILFSSSLLIISACKSNQSSSPPAPQPTAQSITVSASSNMLYIGTIETFTATAQMSDGTTRTVVGGVWGGDNPNVASVETSGRVTIVGSGMVSIYVDYQGRRGSIVIRGLPNYQGTWVGSYVIVGCTETGDFRSGDFCDSFQVGKVFPTDLNLTQDDDRVEGRFYLGAISGDASGPVQTDGLLVLTGSATVAPFIIDATYRLRSEIPGRITEGALNELFIATGWSGYGRLECNIRDLDRTSSMMMPPTGIVPQLFGPTLKDLFRVLISRPGLSRD